MNAIQYIFMRLPLIAVAAVILALILRAAGIKQQRIKQFLYGATLVALALHAVIFLRTTLAYVNFPFEQKSVVEGVTLYNAVEYTHGRQPYRDPTLAPLTPSNTRTVASRIVTRPSRRSAQWFTPPFTKSRWPGSSPSSAVPHSRAHVSSAS